MFGRTGNAKPSVTQASAWVTYLLLGIGIFSPVFCVIWLVQKTVESENALVRQLVADAQERSLADTADLVRLTAMGMIPNEENGGVRYGLSLPSRLVSREEALAAKAKIAEIREQLARLSDREAQAELSKLILDPSFAEVQLLGGRSLDLLLVELGMARIGDEAKPEPGFLAAADGLFIRKMNEGKASRQLRYTFSRYARLSDSMEIARLAKREALLDRWLEEVGSSNDWLQNEGLGSGDGYFYLVNSEAADAYVFPNEALLRACEKLESLRKKRFALSLTHHDDGKAFRLNAPLDFLYLRALEGSDVSEVSSKKAVMYVWIGGIVLALSVFSGVAIVVSVRRQASVTQLKDSLVATVTHELKTPVSSIRLLVDTLMDEERRGKVDTREYIELISRENKRLGRLIDNFLSFSRMERSKGSFDISSIPVASVVEAATEAFRERFKGQRFELEVISASDVPEIAGDKDALATVLGNLLENAFKYGGEDRRIILRTKASPQGAEFEVQDFGPGIGKRDQRKIFRKFFQLDRHASAHSGSVGLGLSIVEFVVSKHSGKVELESEVGKGSIFRVRIPYA